LAIDEAVLCGGWERMKKTEWSEKELVKYVVKVLKVSLNQNVFHFT